MITHKNYEKRYAPLINWPKNT